MPTPTLMDIDDGFGYVLDLVSDPDNPTKVKVSWSGLTGLTVDNLLTSNLTFVGIEKGSSTPEDGEVVQQVSPFTEEQHRSIIVLGTLTHPGAVISASSDNSTPLDSYLADSLSRALGAINVSGNHYTAASSDLTLNHESGVSWSPNINRFNNPLDPDNLATSLEAGITYLHVYNDGSGGVTVASETAIIPGLWDDGSSVLQSVGNNNWTNQLCYFFPSSGIHLIRPGTEVFSNSDDALLARNTIPPVIGTGIDPDLIRTIITVKGNATDLSNSSHAIFTDTGKFGLGSGSGAGAGSDNQFLTIIKATFTVATLPTPAQGMSAYVSDASVTLTAGVGTTVAGAGANYVPVHYNGTNWIIG